MIDIYSYIDIKPALKTPLPLEPYPALINSLPANILYLPNSLPANTFLFLYLHLTYVITY